MFVAAEAVTTSCLHVFRKILTYALLYDLGTYESTEDDSIKAQALRS